MAADCTFNHLSYFSMQFYLLALSFLYCVLQIEADIHSSLAQLQILLAKETDVVKFLDNQTTKGSQRDVLDKFVLEYQHNNEQALCNSSQSLANPVNSYLVIKRLVRNWAELQRLVRTTFANADEIIEKIGLLRNSTGISYPTEDDITWAAISLHRLQDTYRLSTSDLANGYIQGVRRASELTAKDCFDIGNVILDKSDFYHMVLWLQEALQKLEKEQPRTVSIEEILEHLAFALYRQGNAKRAQTFMERLLQLVPNHPRAASNLQKYKQAAELQDPKRIYVGDQLPPLVNKRPEIPRERQFYEALCRGQITQKPLRLSCYYKKDHPYLKLAPFKVEVIHKKPRIVIFRNIMSDAEIQASLKMATPRLERAHVGSPSGQGVVGSDRTAKNAWIFPWESDLIMQLTKRTALATGLDIESFEGFQAANYGIGGHYDPHFDFFPKGIETETDNRLATVLFYMSQPDAGGATVFPKLKLAVPATKNDAVFWYNLLRNCEGDTDTKHAACPVLAGTKWVSNRWIHSTGHEFLRPCGLSQTDVFED